MPFLFGALQYYLVADSHSLTSAAHLVRCHLDIRSARLHELTLPLILQQYMEAFCYIWKGDQMFLVLGLPGSVEIKVGAIEIPGGKDAVNVSVACQRIDGKWNHWCALGKHSDGSAVREWTHQYGNAYDMPQLWAEPAVFALYRQLFHLENEQFQAMGMLADSALEPYNAALGAVRWKSCQRDEDPVAAYKIMDEALPRKMQVTVGTARQVLRRAESRPSVTCPDAVGLHIIRNRGPLSTLEAICHHLVDDRECSMSEVAQRLGVGKSTIQKHVEGARGKLQSSLSARNTPTGASNPGPAKAGNGGENHSQE